MTHRLLIAFDDVLTRPETGVQFIEGEPTPPTDGWLSDDLGIGLFVPNGTVRVRFGFRRPIPIGVIGILNVRSAGVSVASFATFTAAVTARVGTSIVSTETFGISARPRSPFDLDRYHVPTTPVVADNVLFEFTPPSGGAYIGRLFAGPVLSFAGGSEGNLDAGWTMAPTVQVETPIGIAGGARPQPSVTGRRLSFNVSGVPESGALYGTQADRYGLARVEPTAGLADLQERVGSSRPVLAMLRANAAGADRYTYAAYGRLTDPVTITRDRDGGPWSAKFTVQETQR
jgi:hypothetical protein